jgi:hypothetical protein
LGRASAAFAQTRLPHSALLIENPRPNVTPTENAGHNIYSHLNVKNLIAIAFDAGVHLTFNKLLYLCRLNRVDVLAVCTCFMMDNVMWFCSTA